MASVMFRLRQIIIIGILMFGAYLIFNSFTVMQGESTIESNMEKLTMESPAEYVKRIVVAHSDRDRSSSSDKKKSDAESIHHQSCNIPKLDINGSEVISFFNKHEPLNCQRANSGIEDNWVYVDSDGILRFAEKRKAASCKLSYFWRVNDNENKYGEKIQIDDGFKMNESDYATIHCIQGFNKWSSVLWTISYNKTAHDEAVSKLVNNSEEKPLNIYFLGFDSLSQMSFRRKLPKTVDFLEKTLGSVVLNGYNIVGDGTPQAFIPILTAQTETELPLTRKRYRQANYVDNVYPFIWRNYSESGYVTMYGEDAFNIGTFTYRLKGFERSPTDHYTRTLFQEVEKLSDRNCIGSIPLHKMWFNNARRFMNVYNDVPRFLLMHQSLLSHDDINLVGVEDDDLSAHLKQMNDEGMFENAVVIVMADHGHRFAKLRETHQGQLEERMPFFSIHLPKTLTDTNHGKIMLKNLMDNKERLTTPFDIHASLMDILNLPNKKDGFEKMQDTSKRSLSVFRPIPESRSCGEAGIETHWCTCLSWKDAMKSPEDLKTSLKIAHSVVKIINKEIEPEKELCAPLKLKSLVDAKKLLPDEKLLKYKSVKDADGFVPDLSGSTTTAFAHYQLKLVTTPGNAIYEVTLFYDKIKDELKFDFSSLSHVNKYGDTPHCIVDKNFFLATFCVCYDRI